MMRPDFKQYRNVLGSENLQHSAKGSVWDKHKYVKKIDSVYYYPVGYEDGRTVDQLSGNKSKDDKEDSKEKKESSATDKEIERVKKHFDEYLKERGIDWRTLPKEEVDDIQRDIVKQLEKKKAEGGKSTEELAKEVVAGKHGNGKDRKESLGSDYEEVQKIVNELMKKSTSRKKESSEEKKEEKKENTKKKTSSSSSKKSVDLDKVFSVYNKNKKK